MKGLKSVDWEEEITGESPQECAKCLPGRFRGVDKYVWVH